MSSPHIFLTFPYTDISVLCVSPWCNILSISCPQNIPSKSFSVNVLLAYYQCSVLSVLCPLHFLLRSCHLGMLSSWYVVFLVSCHLNVQTYSFCAWMFPGCPVCPDQWMFSGICIPSQPSGFLCRLGGHLDCMHWKAVSITAPETKQSRVKQRQ